MRNEINSRIFTREQLAEMERHTDRLDAALRGYKAAAAQREAECAPESKRRPTDAATV